MQPLVDHSSTQHKSFKAWVNNYLGRREPPVTIEDLQTGFTTGINLVYLLQELIREQNHAANASLSSHIDNIIPKMKNSKLPIQHLENCNRALQIYQQCIRGSSENVNSNKIECTATDLANGNLKLILGMVWTLILKFRMEKLDKLSEQRQAFSSDDADGIDRKFIASTRQSFKASADQSDLGNVFSTTTSLNVEQELLKFVSRQVASVRDSTDLNVTNFTTSWKSGRTMAKLVQSIDKTFLAKTKLSELTPAELNKQACEHAIKVFHIPPLIDPLDLTDNPEKFSVMMFVSYICEYQEQIHGYSMKPLSPKVSLTRRSTSTPRVRLTQEQLQPIPSDTNNKATLTGLSELDMWLLALLAVLLILVELCW